ncbi:MAG: O-acetyl-ADP-ribose deacetylase [Clostridiales bacterium]|nr:O-acetyl-ADP-ribose deacetylase [Clostridiales bacterium]
MHIKVLVGDITKLKVVAIVNAAKNSLLGGGGVDGAIHRAAGPALLAECRTLNGCETGDTKITMGYQLPAKYVIHTVGPVWNGGNQNEPELLASCYRSCLRIAKEKRLDSIAFPAISTGVYGYPKDQAAEVAVRTIIEETKDAGEDFEAILVAFDAETEQLYNQVIQRVAIG